MDRENIISMVKFMITADYGVLSNSPLESFEIFGQEYHISFLPMDPRV